MSPDGAKIKGSPAPTLMTSQQVLEELAELIRDLHGLLESYAPLWYTEDIDIRVTEMRARLTLLKRSPHDSMKEDSARF